MDAILATIFGSGQAIGQKQDELWNQINFSVISIYIKHRLRALAQPLRMAAHASDWGGSLNRRCREDKRNITAMIFVGGFVLMFDRFLVLFLL